MRGDRNLAASPHGRTETPAGPGDQRGTSGAESRIGGSVQEIVDCRQSLEHSHRWSRSSRRPYADVFARLCDFDQSGRSVNVCDDLVSLADAMRLAAPQCNYVLRRTDSSVVIASGYKSRMASTVSDASSQSYCWRKSTRRVGSHERLHLAKDSTSPFIICLTTAAPEFVSRCAAFPNERL